MILAILAWTLTLTIFDGHVRNIVNLVRLFGDQTSLI